MDKRQGDQAPSGSKAPASAGTASAETAADASPTTAAPDRHRYGYMGQPAKPVPEVPLTDWRRLAISGAMYVGMLAWLAHVLLNSGTVDSVASYWRAAVGPPCGLLQAKEYVVASDRLALPYGTFPGLLHVRGGVIVDIKAAGSAVGGDRHALLAPFLRHHPGITVLDYGSSMVSPGLIDVHVHMNEPGREDWEGMETATSAAAAGGVTTVIDMPLNSHPCTTTVAELRRKIVLAKQKAKVNVGFWAGLVPENAHAPRDLKALVGAGALGFKSFMAPSGIDDFPNVSAHQIEAALPTLRQLGVPLLVHAELVDDNVPQGGNPRSHATWLASHPRRFEKGAVRVLLAALRAVAAGPGSSSSSSSSSSTKSTGAAGMPGFGLHVVHLADADLLPELVAAKGEGLPLTVETCPHYLNFPAEEVPEGDTRFKCAPPLREGENAARLLAGLLDGSIDSVATDHSPSTPDLKRLEDGDFMAAWGGIAGLQYALPSTWHPLVQGAAAVNFTRLAQLWSAAPARLAGLGRSKGVLKIGYDADLVVWDPEQLADTSAAALHHRHKVTPYADRQMHGRVRATFVRGSQVYAGEHGQVAEQACGAVLLHHKLRRRN